MGGRGSTRWGRHIKRPLVEEALAVDLVALRLAGLYERPGTGVPITWTRGTSGAVVATGQACLVVVDDDDRHLDVVIVVRSASERLSVRLDLVPFHPSLGGTRWFLRCPEDDCGRRALRMYLSPEADRIACRRCLGLVHRSAQEHDARLDEARRDPRGFAASRSRHRGMWSDVVTAHLAMRGLETMAAPRRGRGWGALSTTAWSRTLDSLAAEYQARWGEPLLGSDQHL